MSGIYVVVGMGISGRAVIRFLLDRGEECIGVEELSRENFSQAKREFKGKKIPLFFEKFPLSVFEKAKGFIVSPGVPLTRPWAHEALKKGLPVLGELELASRHLSGSLLAVTGTNGKSTTVSLMHAILKEGGIRTSLKGNIGDPLVTAVGEPPRDWHVVEVSSFQLETIETFRPKISVMLNVTSDHLDRYPDMTAYASAKARIFMNQRGDDYFLYNADDSCCLHMARKTAAIPLPFSLVNHFKEGGFVDRDEIVIRFKGGEDRYPANLGPLVGLHNQENKVASILAATIVGVTPAAISRALKTFRPLRHRLQKVGEFRGIVFYDDSKGTNIGSVVMSLASFDGRVLLILGGRDKGSDFSPLKSLIRAKVKALILMGEAREKIGQVLGGIVPTHSVVTMKEAVQACYESGETGDVALLSPGCASFDQYKNYAERGDDFARWVQHLK